MSVPAARPGAVPPVGWRPGPLMVVTDRHQAHAAGHDLVDVVAAAVAAGADAVLLRDRDLPGDARRRLAGALAPIVAEAGADLVVAGGVALARAVGAVAHHLSAADAWPAGTPTGGGPGDGVPGPGVPPDAPVAGRSCHTVDELRQARRRGLAYATVSPVFATPSKPGYGPALGRDGLAEACAAVPDLPVVALGGVVSGRVGPCLAAGAHSVAVMGAVMGAGHPGAVVRALAAEVTAGTQAPGVTGRGAGAGAGPAAAASGGGEGR